MSKSCVVLGGGFKGMLAAYMAAKKGIETHLVEKAPFLGGIMHGWEWNGFYVDKGVHLFDSIPVSLGAIVEEVMDGDVLPIDFSYGSVMKKTLTPGLAIPDFTSLDEETKKTILFEIVNAVARPAPAAPKNLKERLIDLYGPTAAQIMGRHIRHIYRVGAEEMDPDSLRQVPFHRLRFLDNEMSIELKKNPELDKRLAAMRKALGKVDDFVSMYPGRNGMYGFCVKMTEKLRALGVKIHLGQETTAIRVLPNRVQCQFSQAGTLEFDHLICGQDHALLSQIWLDDNRLSKKNVGTPMVLYGFEVDAKSVNNLTYIHQFDLEARVFRISAAGTYGRQIKPDGKTYIIVECPTDINSPQWNEPEQFLADVWEECLWTSVITEKGPVPKNYMIKKAPITHRFNLAGSAELIADIDHKIAATNGAIVMPRKEAFTRREIMWVVDEAIQAL